MSQPKYQLYYSPGSCSMAIHVLLNEVGASFTLENTAIKDGKNRSEAFLKINPRGQVPALVEDGKAMLEGGAILTYLCDKYNSPLLPKDGWARAQALQWLMFCNSTLHPAYSRCFWLNRMTETGKEVYLAKAVEWVNRLWQDIEAELQNKPYLCGNECTIGDVLLTVIANWSNNIPLPITIGPKTRALFARVIARPSYQKALATEQVEYKMAS
ncbi:MAG: glutathione S-transferase family protein [Alphaproteobacteria bacterium]|nr:glutathione S-transferase family protein [Alphaproteobacteria bacterium]